MKTVNDQKLYFAQDFQDILSHGVLVSRLAYRLGRELKLSDWECHELAVAGVIHDIGKLQLTRYLHNHAVEEEMSLEEIQYMHMHSKCSYRLLKKYDYSDFVLLAVLYHHENYDGTGYPENLQGVDIPFEARILRVCDVFAALISKRIYRDAFSVDAAVEVMIDEIKNYDMKVFLAFQRMVHEEDFLKCLGTPSEMEEFKWHW